MPNLYPVEDNGMIVCCVDDPRPNNPGLVVNEFAGAADYPDGPFPVLGRKADDPTVFHAFETDEICVRSGFDPIQFTVVPDWGHYLWMTRRSH